MSDPVLTRKDKGAVAVLKLNMPGTLNALSEAMLTALQSEFDALSKDRTIRAVVLHGVGKAFCAGHDLREMTEARKAADGGRAYFEDLFNRCAAMMMSILRLPQPVIAAPHGVAAAAGCQLVATCDMAVAAPGTRFGVNGVNIGLFCSTPMVALTRNIGRKKAMEMLVTGDFIDSEDALQLGLINRMADGDHVAAAMDLAEQVTAKLGKAVAIGKEAFYVQAELGLSAAYEYTGAVMAENMMLEETQDGILAFLDKRRPDWEQ
ncbi:enoyl-CoA hydratase [Halovulum sp. GXIMD14793]